MFECPEEKKILEFFGKSFDDLTTEEVMLIIDHNEKCPFCNALWKKEIAELPDDYFEELDRKIWQRIHEHVKKMPWRERYALKFRLFKNNMRAKLDKFLKMRYTA